MHRPSFYAERFFKFMSNTVFRKNSCECPGPLDGGVEGGGWKIKGRVNLERWSCVQPALGLRRGPGPGHRAVGVAPAQSQSSPSRAALSK